MSQNEGEIYCDPLGELLMWCGLYGSKWQMKNMEEKFGV